VTTLPRALLVEVSAAYHRTAALLELAVADNELAPDYALYSLLSRVPRSTPTELATALGVPMSTTVSRVNRLVDRGHAERSRNPRDGRSSYVSLTDEGRRRLEATAAGWERALAALRRNLPGTDEEATVAVAVVRDAIEAAIEELVEAAYVHEAA
jgi:DNA-binding MarR family transcriptional regulator